MAWVSDLILATSVDGYTGCARAIQGLDLTDALSEIRAKTLIVPGEYDLGFPEKVSTIDPTEDRKLRINFAERRRSPRQRRTSSSLQRNPPGLSRPDYLISPSVPPERYCEAPPEPGLHAWTRPKTSPPQIDHFTAPEQGVEFSRRAFSTMPMAAHTAILCCLRNYRLLT